MRLRGDVRGPMLCFVGAPGVGKTTLGRSIARALGRAFVSISLGGIRDEAEIRGHRRTYVGAMPGRVIAALKQAGARNPVVVLDELDKLGADGRGDPSAALLEVLDPEQHRAFRDHYLGVPFDLSRVVWVATANLPDAIPAPLRDRMELVYVPGYALDEKVEIVRRFLLPRQRAAAGLGPDELALGRKTIEALVEGYTHEAGVRELDRLVAALARKVARGLAEHGKAPAIGARTLAKLLGPGRPNERSAAEDAVGVATGLAWTEAGGAILEVEVSAMRGVSQLTLTGQLGKVMKESAQAALSFARSSAEALGIDEQSFRDREFHVHVPQGAIPKDGPSAGVTMATALVSMLTGCAVRAHVAMTGEITLRGRVLPVGGIREKLLAAARAGIRDVIVPDANAPELAELPENLRSKLTVHRVRRLEEVLALALVGWADRASPAWREPGWHEIAHAVGEEGRARPSLAAEAEAGEVRGAAPRPSTQPVRVAPGERAGLAAPRPRGRARRGS
jgi:ATP-dependent Lon protease